MKSKFDNRVVLSAERNDKRYSWSSWSIKEFDKSGKQIGQDQIPNSHSQLKFQVIELNRSLEINGREIFEGSQTNEVFALERLQGKLLPEGGTHSYSISMFGTQREIKKFGLAIHRATENEEERCRVGSWPDYLQITVLLSPEKLDHVLNRFSVATGMKVRLIGVSGFYSHVPDIGARSIKILADTKEQKLENPENLAIDPPILGHVREFQILFNRARPLGSNDWSINS
jgi:hypothetical protein